MSEAEIFSRYLSGAQPSPELAQRYADACSRLNLQGDARDVKIVSFAVRHPAFLPLLDAGLAFSAHKSLLRKKLLVMLALLETTTTHYHLFATKDEPRSRWIGLFFRGCGAVVKMMLGKLILIFI